MRRCVARQRRSFSPGCSAHTAYHHRLTAIGATIGGVVVLPASGITTNGDLQRSISRSVCMFERRVLMGLMWLAACLSREGWAFVGRAPRESQHGKRGKRGGYRSQMDRYSGPARIGRSRVVLARCCRSCRSRQAASDREKRALFTSPDLESVRGRRSSP
jgi:hypothetical protein